MQKCVLLAVMTQLYPVAALEPAPILIVAQIEVDGRLGARLVGERMVGGRGTMIDVIAVVVAAEVDLISINDMANARLVSSLPLYL